MTFLKLGSTSLGFGGCVWNFVLKATGSQIFTFQCDRDYHVSWSLMCAMINL